MGRLLYSFGEEGLGFFVRSDLSVNELIPTVCHTIFINRPVSEVMQFPISRHERSSLISFFLVFFYANVKVALSSVNLTAFALRSRLTGKILEMLNILHCNKNKL